jgi:O-phosphoseryl-tRNA synthetase
VVEREANTMLLGPAALNEIFVYEGGVYGIPKDTSKLKENVAEIQKKGIKLEFGFIDAVSDYFAAEVERKVAAGEREGFLQIKMARGPSDVNIAVSERGRRFIESKNKPISLKGPVFAAIDFRSN